MQALQSFVASVFSFLYILISVLSNTGVNKPDFFNSFKKHSMPPAGYELVMEDNFDGTELNKDIWYSVEGAARDGYYSDEQAVIEDGMLKIKYEHLPDGKYGEGFYSSSLLTHKKYTRGYFECRCRCNRTVPGGCWSAFWLQPGNPYDPEVSRGGIGGAEIDIMETFASTSGNGKPKVTAVVHCNGSKNNAAYRAEHPEKELDTQLVYKSYLYDAFDTFHTYSLLWDEESYTFFIDGRKMAETSWADGVSTVPAEVRLSLEQAWKSPEDLTVNSEYAIDYVRVYQPAGDIQVSDSF